MAPWERSAGSHHVRILALRRTESPAACLQGSTWQSNRALARYAILCIGVQTNSGSDGGIVRLSWWLLSAPCCWLLYPAHQLDSTVKT